MFLLFYVMELILILVQVSPARIAAYGFQEPSCRQTVLLLLPSSPNSWKWQTQLPGRLFDELLSLHCLTRSVFTLLICVRSSCWIHCCIWTLFIIMNHVLTIPFIFYAFLFLSSTSKSISSSKLIK